MKKIIYIIVLINFIATGIYSQEIVYTETFESEPFIWQEFYNSSGSASINDKQYILKSKNVEKTEIFSVYSGHLIDFTKDFEIEIEVEKSEGKFSFFWAELIEELNLTVDQDYILFSKYSSEVDNLKKIINNELYDIEELYKLKINNYDNNLMISIVQNDSIYNIFEGDNIAEKGNASFGFRLANTDKNNVYINSIKINGHAYLPEDINTIQQNDYHIVKQNLGEKINTDNSEMKPIISGNGNNLYFIRNIDGRDIIHKANLSENEVVKLPYPINLPNSNSVLINVTPDENSIYKYGIYEEDAFLADGISFSIKNKKGWSDFYPIAIKDFETESNSISNYISNDKKYFLTSLENDDSEGGHDIFICFLDRNGYYKAPINLGTTINTDDEEISPYLAADNKTLYFSSSGHNGYGIMDIFMSKRLDDSWQTWSEPVNLGPNINTPGWDSHFCIDVRGEYAYLVSKVNSYGKNDIFRIEIDENLIPSSVVLLKGKVLNKNDQKPVGAAELVFSPINDDYDYGTAISNADDGGYKIILPAGKSYQIFAKAKNYYSISEFIEINKDSEYKEVNKDILMVPIEKGETFVLNNLFFDSGSHNLKVESYSELNRLSQFLLDNPKLKVEIGGHTDEVGSKEENYDLSFRRAQSVVNYLIINGIKPNRIIHKGYGETKPFSSNSDEKGRSKNRRVECKIIEK